MLSNINAHQKCYKDFVLIENNTKKAIIIRYQYPIVEKSELKEIEQWDNKVLYNNYIKYGGDPGFLVVEYLYEMRNEQWIQKAFRISADWEGLSDQVKKMHRSYGILGGKRIKRAKPQ